MCRCVDESDLTVLSELLAAGIPLGEEEALERSAANRSLSVKQVAPGRIFTLDCGAVGYHLGIEIRNNSNLVILVSAFRLEMVWEDSQFVWLAPSKRRAQPKKVYLWPKDRRPGIPAHDVLNHRIGRHGRLFPGDSMGGFLLGIGEAPIPDTYRGRKGVRTQLSVFDGRGNRYRASVKFEVRRTAPVPVNRPGPRLWDSVRKTREALPHGSMSPT